MVITERSKVSGFTLVELLLAMSLLMLVMYSGYYAYSLYSSSWEKRSKVFWENTKSSLAFDAIDRALSSVTPYIVLSDKGEPAMYFQGSNSRLIFVSGSPIFSQDSGIVELAFEQGDENNYRLVYRESPLSQLLLLKQSDDIFWQKQVVLIENVYNASFSYFGWSSYQQILKNITIEQKNLANTDANIMPATWYNQHDLQVRRILPIKVKIQFSNDDARSTDIELKLPENAYLNLVHYLRDDA